MTIHPKHFALIQNLSICFW